MSRDGEVARLSSATPRSADERDPAASMTLLLEMMRHPLDPAYEEAARRRADAAETRPRASGVQRVVLAVVTLSLGFAVGAAVSALKVPKKVTSDAHSQLVKEVESKQKSNEDTAASIRSLRSDVAARRAAALEGSASGALEQQISDAESAAALRTASGPGLVLTLQNPPDTGTQDADSDPRTQGSATTLSSRDLQRVVNGLWEAGATGIAINDQRLTASSAIRFAGTAVLVNYRPLTTPYVIKAIGSGSLKQHFEQTDGSAYLRTLQRSGFDIATKNESALTLSGGSSSPLRYAKTQ